MIYFSRLVSHNQASNSLQRQAITLLKQESNLLVDDVDAFTEKIRRRIQMLNAENPRCKPVVFSSNRGDIGWVVTRQIWIGQGTNTLASFALYPVKNDTAKEVAA